MPVPIVSRRLNEPFNLAFGEVLAGTIFGIRQPTASNCSLFGGWSAGRSPYSKRSKVRGFRSSSNLPPTRMILAQPAVQSLRR